jgi:fatty acid desaturase
VSQESFAAFMHPGPESDMSRQSIALLAFSLAILSCLIPLLLARVVGFNPFFFTLPLTLAWAGAVGYALWWVFAIAWIDYVCTVRHDCL